jgi:hypothetical protein
VFEAIDLGLVCSRMSTRDESGTFERVEMVANGPGRDVEGMAQECGVDLYSPTVATSRVSEMGELLEECGFEKSRGDVTQGAADGDGWARLFVARAAGGVIELAGPHQGLFGHLDAMVGEPLEELVAFDAIRLGMARLVAARDQVSSLETVESIADGTVGPVEAITEIAP